MYNIQHSNDNLYDSNSFLEVRTHITTYKIKLI